MAIFDEAPQFLNNPVKLIFFNVSFLCVTFVSVMYICLYVMIEAKMFAFEFVSSNEESNIISHYSFMSFNWT